MNILLTNDDGIHAPGIAALHNALTDKSHPDGPLGNIFTVAPASPQSATSHGITYHTPLMVEHTTINNQPALAVEGRPADCSKLALTNLYPEHHGQGARPDLVISGMNAGANCGINVIYSGTVAAAIEAAFIGVPAIAVSLHLDSQSSTQSETRDPTQYPDWNRAAKAARKTIDALLQTGLPNQHEVLSINIPATQYLNDNTKAVVCPRRPIRTTSHPKEQRLLLVHRPRSRVPLNRPRNRCPRTFRAQHHHHPTHLRPHQPRASLFLERPHQQHIKNPGTIRGFEIDFVLRTQSTRLRQSRPLLQASLANQTTARR